MLGKGQGCEADMADGLPGREEGSLVPGISGRDVKPPAGVRWWLMGVRHRDLCFSDLLRDKLLP